ncbi:uncharacterized protein LOC129241053 isoform X1 [Anastrepha obliqua]|uniref:uncharacterized protein LOC129241053 isoform X1 n=2 Tax=Anastrepha obliqua TaxID=95512 RepID=UPI00240A8C3F|nr:uncharacterized protein LOC129241053 isoform X1 [Anastrepha obliqua]
MEQSSNENVLLKRIASVTVWSESETRLLFDKYASYCPEIGPMKNLRNKKEMWEKISKEIKGKTAKQCEERYKTVLKRKKTVPENSHTSGVKIQRVDYENDPEDTSAFDDFIEPEVHLSSQEVGMKNVNVEETLFKIAQRKKESSEWRHRERMESLNNFQQLLSNSLQRKEVEKKTTLQDTLLEIAQIKEEGKERRHREKMELLNSIQQILSNLLQANVPVDKSETSSSLLFFKEEW